MTEHHSPDDKTLPLTEPLSGPPVSAHENTTEKHRLKFTYRLSRSFTMGRLWERFYGTRHKQLCVLFLLFVFLCGLGWWIHSALSNALKDIHAKQLQALLHADVLALQIWVDERKNNVAIWAEDETVQTSTDSLVRSVIYNGDAAASNLPLQSAWQELNDTLKKFVERHNGAGYTVSDRTGLILASSKLSNLGKRLSPKGVAHLAEVFTAGQPLIAGPDMPGTWLHGGAADTLQKPLIGFSHLINNHRGEPVAVLTMSYFGDATFTDILRISRMGDSGETYAFNASGLMLSESRFNDELRAIGLLENTAESRSMLTIQLRDPGGDLTKGYQPNTEAIQQPFTHLVATALASDLTASSQGILMEPYNDYRGVPVIGAWGWLPEYQWGIAIEVDAEEAFWPLNYLRTLFAILFLVLLIFVITTLKSSSTVVQLRKEVGKAKRVGQYTLKDKLGAGGMGDVYLAEHALLKRPTAVKMLRADTLNSSSIQRFEREVVLTSQLSHPNTIAIYDYGHTENGEFYYAMEYIDGITLDKLQQLEKTISPARCIFLLKQICGSLREAHDRGLIHRDLKPLNIMVCQRGGEFGVVKVLDFGLVKDTADRDAEQTSMAELSGTPLYMAPERILSPGKADGRVDIYALGIIAYKLLTGRNLFEPNEDEELFELIINGVVPRPSDHADNIPEAFDDLIYRCMQKKPEDRPVNIRTLIHELNKIECEDTWGNEQAAAWWEKFTNSQK